MIQHIKLFEDYASSLYDEDEQQYIPETFEEFIELEEIEKYKDEELVFANFHKGFSEYESEDGRLTVSLDAETENNATLTQLYKQSRGYFYISLDGTYIFKKD